MSATALRHGHAPWSPVLLVIGGGCSGVPVAQGATQAGFRVILVDPKSFFSIPYASLRASVLPDSPPARDHIVEYSQVPRIGEFKQGRVVDLTRDTATLDNGETLRFDFCVLAMGSSNAAGTWAQPQGTDIASRRAELQANSKLVRDAKRIVIVGAGTVGVELAAEIAEAYAGKSITLVCATGKLFEGRPSGMGSYTAQWLTSHKVEVLYHEKATAKNEKCVVLSSGAELHGDLVIWTVGAKPNTEFLKSTELASVLDSAGRVKVDPFLRVVGFPNFFAIGDINDVQEEKQGYLGTLHGHLTAKNLAALHSGFQPPRLKAWKPANGMKAVLVSLGSVSGTGAVSICTLPAWLVGLAKGRGLMIGKVRHELGITGISSSGSS